MMFGKNVCDWWNPRKYGRHFDQAWSQRQVHAVIVAGDFNAVRGHKPLLPVQGDLAAATPICALPGAHATASTTGSG